jgi:CubicO group peptidase (beta-lactamase class C family)
LVLDSGKWDGKQIVSKEFIQEMLTPNMIPDLFGAKTDYYGLHWWLMDFKGHRVVYARGILGQYIAVVPDQNLIVVRLGHIRGEKSGNHYADLVEYLNGAFEVSKQ